jgi:hypothetical protein|tara:strand:- start:723 stop:1010 length:288 start_codon:yes stop_codon:yes gene_type:complete
MINFLNKINNIATTVRIPDIELTFEGIVTLLFQICCGIIYLIGEVTGLGYELANLLIFVVIHPLITLTFYILWKKAKCREKYWEKLARHHFSQRK